MIKSCLNKSKTNIMIAKRYFLLIAIMIIALSVSAQKVKNKQFSLFSYNLNISDDIVEELAELESFIDDIKTYNDPGNDKLQAILVHIIYYTLKEKLDNELEMEILPINTFMRKVKYDDYGYPNTSVRDAIKKGYSKYFFKVKVNIESLTKDKQKENPEIFEELDYPAIFPQMTIEITIFNKEGVIPVDKWVGTTTARYPLPVNEYLLKGFDNTQMEVQSIEKQQADNFYLMLDRAIHNAIQDYHTK